MTRRKRTVDRRTALEALAAGIAAGSAGCLDGLVGDSNPDTPADTPTQTPTETPTATPTETPTGTPVKPLATPDYLDWMFAPGLMNSSWPINVFLFDPATIVSHREDLNSDATKIINNRINPALVATKIDSYSVSQLIRTRGCSVLLGEFTQRHIDENRESRFKRDLPEYREFIIYEDTEEGQAIAAKDGVAVMAESPGQPNDPQEVVKHIIDTGLGDIERLADARPTVEPLASWLGARTFTNITMFGSGSEQEPAGKISGGLGYTFKEEHAEGRFVLQFEEPSQATDEAVDTEMSNVPVLREWTDTTRQFFGEIVAVDTDVKYDSLLSA